MVYVFKIFKTVRTAKDDQDDFILTVDILNQRELFRCQAKIASHFIGQLVEGDDDPVIFLEVLEEGLFIYIL